MDRLLKYWWFWPLLTIAMLVLALLAQLLSWMSPMAFVIVAVLLIILQFVLFVAAISRRQTARIIGTMLLGMVSTVAFCFYVGVVGVTKLVGMLLDRETVVTVDGPHMEDVIGQWKTDEGATLVFNRDGSCFVRNYNWEKPTAVSGSMPNYLMGVWRLLTETDSTKATVEVHFPDIDPPLQERFKLQFKGQGLFGNDRPYDLVLEQGDPDTPEIYPMHRTGDSIQHFSHLIGRVEWSGTDSLMLYDDRHVAADTAYSLVLLYRRRTVASYPMHRPFYRINAVGHLMVDSIEVDFTRGLPDSIGNFRRTQ